MLIRTYKQDVVMLIKFGQGLLPQVHVSFTLIQLDPESFNHSRTLIIKVMLINKLRIRMVTHFIMLVSLFI